MHPESRAALVEARRFHYRDPELTASTRTLRLSASRRFNQLMNSLTPSYTANFLSSRLPNIIAHHIRIAGTIDTAQRSYATSSDRSNLADKQLTASQDAKKERKYCYIR